MSVIGLNQAWPIRRARGLCAGLRSALAAGVQLLFHICVDQILTLNLQRSLDPIDEEGPLAASFRILVSRALRLPRCQHDAHLSKNLARFLKTDEAVNPPARKALLSIEDLHNLIIGNTS